jgi:LacI family gluconate utilization system Gnt-I transcriptional repressor
VKPRRESKRANHVKLSDVAKKVGVSPITISRALRNPEIVSEDLREVILRTVEEMGYIPNLAARALAGRHNGIVGVITPAINQYIFTSVMAGIEDRFLTTDLRVQYANTLFGFEQEVNHLKSFLAQKPAGVILVGAEHYNGTVPLIEGAACPVVHITDLSQQPDSLVVSVDHHAAGMAATRFLLSRGYSRIGFIGGMTSIRARRRQEGYELVMRETGRFDPALVAVEEEPTSVGLGRRLFSRLLDSAPDIDAVFTQNDDLALGVLFECAQRAIDVPGKIGVCGFNDLDFAPYTQPPLTTVHIPRYDAGYRAADMLMRALRDEPPAESRIDLGFSIVERGSTR